MEAGPGQCPSCGRAFPVAGGYCPDDGTRVVSTAPAPNSLQGRTLDNRYQILEPLAQPRPGAIGAMYRGYQLSVSREVAIKVIDPMYGRDYETVERFLHAGRRAAQLIAPALANVYDVGRTSDGMVYVVSELVRGRPLTDYLGQPMPVRRAVAIALQLVDALAAVHGARLVHGDLDPANIIVDEPPTGGRDVIKLLDVGLATAINARGATPTYVAPEQPDGNPDARSDLYALGAILYHLLCGAAPFTAASNEALAGKHRSERPTPLPPNIPAPLAAITHRLLAKAPGDRYAAATDLRVQLLEVQAMVGVAVARTSSADLALPRTTSNPNLALPRTASADFSPPRTTSADFSPPRTTSADFSPPRTTSADFSPPRTISAQGSPPPAASSGGRRVFVILLVAAIATGLGITAIMLAT